MSDDTDLLDVSFAAEVVEWRGPAPFYFVAAPEEHTGEVHDAAREASYGWGVVPVEVTVAGVDFRTSLFPRDGGYMLPLRLAVRRAADLTLGQTVRVRLRVAARSI